MLTIAWLIGWIIEVVFPSTMPWHWHYARLAVMLVFWIWAWQRTKRRIFPLIFTSFILSVETLFLVNDPGVIPYGSWLFNAVLVLVAWLTSKSDWGIAAALIGSWLLNQALVRFTYEGIVRHADFPDPFVWNFSVGLFTVWAGLRQGYRLYTKREVQKRVTELPLMNGVGAYEPSEERELQ
ncbi:hypothetical protein [Desulfosporosinus sp. Sb-LF]|uniref:hypothetical protein n=1 Tax=Desulfosporosinus sp. Sb-LF TaxID=2560027 RepID=UPI001FB10B2A|nr:hypothetical protein [Desulfosporosinus sp. Sb-LF]